MADEVLTDKEAQAVLKLSRVELYRQRKAGKLAFCQFGTKIRYLRSDIDKFIADHRAECVPESVQPSKAQR